MAQYLGISDRSDLVARWPLFDGLWLSPPTLWRARCDFEGWAFMGRQGRIRHPRRWGSGQDGDRYSRLEPDVARQRPSRQWWNRLGQPGRLPAHRLSDRATAARWNRGCGVS